MAKSARIFAIFHDTEASYGTGGNPASAAKALLAFDAPPPNLRAEERPRNFLQPYYGEMPSDLSGKVYPYAYALEMQGSGIAGAAPPIAGPLLDCGITELSLSNTDTVDAAATPVGTPTGSFTYVVANGGTPKVMRKVTLTCTTGGGSGTAEFTVSAPATGKGDCAESVYNQTGVVMTDSGAFALPNGVEITPTVGDNFAIADTFVIWIGPDRVEYWPTTDRANHASGIVHFHGHDSRKVIPGNRANLRILAQKTQHMRAVIEAMGLYNAPTKVAMLGPDYTAFQKPALVNVDNTWLFELFGISAVMESAEFNFNNQVELIDRVGRREVVIADRKVRGTFMFEAPDLATKNFFTDVDNRATGVFRMVHGTTPGKIVDIMGGRIELMPLEERDSQGDVMLNVNVKFLPVDTAIGDDEIVVRFY